MTTKVNPTIPSEDHPRLGPATRLLGERSASDHYLHLKHHPVSYTHLTLPTNYSV